MPPKLPRTKRRIFEAIEKRPGITAMELLSEVWKDDPAGGPEDRKCIHVHIHQLNKRLAREGLYIKGHVTDGYRLFQYKSVDL